MVKPLVHIVILDFLKAPLIKKNIKNILQQETTFPFFISIIDNSENKNNAYILKKLKKENKIRVIINKKNNGHPKGCNQGAKKNFGEKYLLIMNPDIDLKEKDSLQNLVDFMEKNQKIGVCGVKQKNDGKNEYAMSIRAYPNLLIQIIRRTPLRNLPYLKELVAFDEMKHFNHEKTQELNKQWLQGSFMFFRRKIWDKIGGFDESYFLFMADALICKKVIENNYKVYHFSKVEVKADGKRVSGEGFLDIFTNKVLQYHIKDAIRYWLKENLFPFFKK